MNISPCFHLFQIYWKGHFYSKIFKNSNGFFNLKNIINLINFTHNKKNHLYHPNSIPVHRVPSFRPTRRGYGGPGGPQPTAPGTAFNHTHIPARRNVVGRFPRGEAHTLTRSSKGVTGCWSKLSRSPPSRKSPPSRRRLSRRRGGGGGKKLRLVGWTYLFHVFFVFVCPKSCSPQVRR